MVVCTPILPQLGSLFFPYCYLCIVPQQKLRKQIDGLASLVQTQFGQEMDETSLYLFCGRRADRIKALYWDGTGYILLYKRLTEKRFQWPRSEKDLKKLTLQEFRWLMEGLSITQRKAFVAGKPGTVC